MKKLRKRGEEGQKQGENLKELATISNIVGKIS
jgi:hypothetical protein